MYYFKLFNTANVLLFSFENTRKHRGDTSNFSCCFDKIGKEADYLLALKGNQGNLLESGIRGKRLKAGWDNQYLTKLIKKLDASDLILEIN